MFQLGLGLKCFSDLGGLEMTLCEERKGFRTCFLKYDNGKTVKYPVLNLFLNVSLDGFVTGRGCATKDPMFITSCENHIMGAPHQGERFCYCGTNLCNLCCATKSAFILISFLLICNFLIK